MTLCSGLLYMTTIFPLAADECQWKYSGLFYYEYIFQLHIEVLYPQQVLPIHISAMLHIILVVCFYLGIEAYGIPGLQRFKCRNGRAIQIDLFCDGTDDCGDGSDEKSHSTLFDQFAEWQSCLNPYNLFNGSCLVQRQLVCDDEVKCIDLTPCDLKCASHYKCQEWNDCAPRSTICNHDSCDGCEEDHGWKNGHGFKCRRNGMECVLPQQLLYDDISDCDGGIDICFSGVDETSRNERQPASNILRDKCFQCLDNNMIIPSSSVCDGVIDCPDLSDECLCGRVRRRPKICDKVVDYVDKTATSNNTESKRSGLEIAATCPIGHVKCGSGKCITRRSVCDGIPDCDLDEKFHYCQGTISCRDAGEKERCRCHVSRNRCENLYGIACDGKADCPSAFPGDMDTNGRPEDECDAFCDEVPRWNYQCANLMRGFSLTITQTIPCKPVATDSLTSVGVSNFLTAYNESHKCDGVQDCAKGDDEENCPNRFRCDVINGIIISIDLNKTCDGHLDCRNGTDESEELCGDSRFQCLALGGEKVNIDSALVCDFHITCDDASDEKNCSDGRFYCENGEPLFVHQRKMFNRRADCSDWSDECPTTDAGTTDMFSSRSELIANPILRALVWIMGILSLCGNSTVLHLESKKLRENHNLTPIASANRLLVLNLAASDILMGIYLLSLGISGLLMQGNYCSQELLWRSSTSCVVLGVLSVLSSETSVITMIMLTSCRLYAVLKPFQSACHPRKRTVALMIIASWCVSLSFALVPLLPGLATIFVSHVQFKEDIFFASPRTKITKARELFSSLLTYDLQPNVTIPGNLNVEELSWREMRSWSSKIFVHDHFEVSRSFGYYSINSVCIPKFFVTSSDRSWGFSFFVNLFNFCSFVFVATAYAAIYYQSRKRAKVRTVTRKSDKGVTDLQKKILRLIITDFFCWIPICIMAFAKLAGAHITETAYVIAAIVLLPINSALNPILYSALPDFLYQTAMSKFNRTSSSLDNNVSDQSSSKAERRATDSSLVMSIKKSFSNKNSNNSTHKAKYASSAK